MNVDFHCHSSASDGTNAPAELVEKGKAGGLTALALTDHDNCDGIAEFLASDHGDCRLVAGVELSIEPGESFDKFHLLALGIDPTNAALKDLLARVLEGRNARNRKILENFRRLGFEMETPDAEGRTIFDYAHGEVLARPHFARWLMDHGGAESVKDGFKRYLTPESPSETRCYEERWHPPQEETFRVIHGAGGLCVMAHPKFWRNHWKFSLPEYDDAERGLAELKEKGLDGLEAVYHVNRPSENIEFSRLATKLGLLKTAGSDFHGTNKPTVPFGMTVDDSFIAPFLERLNLV